MILRFHKASNPKKLVNFEFIKFFSKPQKMEEQHQISIFGISQSGSATVRE